MATPGESELSAAAFRPVRGHHAFEGCVERLATAIRLGIYPNGSNLPPERELAERMGVSRATLRQGIAALRTAGMVRTTRGRGGGTIVEHQPEIPSHATLPNLDERRDQLLDALVFRRIVEPGASYRAACQPTTAEQQHLLRTSLKEVEGAPDPASHRQADSRLHLAIATASGSAMTVSAVTEVQAQLHEMLNAIPVLDVNIEHSNAQHDAIVAAILSDHATKARRVMESHCDDTAALLRGLLG